MPELGEQILVEGRYYNANWYACAIVAVITHGVDWAAYIGGCPHGISSMEAHKFVAETGSKLLSKDARYYFPDIELPYRG